MFLLPAQTTMACSINLRKRRIISRELFMYHQTTQMYYFEPPSYTTTLARKKKPWISFLSQSPRVAPERSSAIRQTSITLKATFTTDRTFSRLGSTATRARMRLKKQSVVKSTEALPEPPDLCSRSVLARGDSSLAISCRIENRHSSCHGSC